MSGGTGGRARARQHIEALLATVDDACRRVEAMTMQPPIDGGWLVEVSAMQRLHELLDMARRNQKPK